MEFRCSNCNANLTGVPITGKKCPACGAFLSNMLTRAEQERVVQDEWQKLKQNRVMKGTLGGAFPALIVAFGGIGILSINAPDMDQERGMTIILLLLFITWIVVGLIASKMTWKMIALLIYLPSIFACVAIVLLNQG